MRQIEDGRLEIIHHSARQGLILDVSVGRVEDVDGDMASSEEVEAALTCHPPEVEMK